MADKTDDTQPDSPDTAGETHIRGKALRGSEQKQAVDHTQYDQTRNPDAVLRLDGEKDTLYNDGLDVEDDSPPFVGTPGNDSTR